LETSIKQKQKQEETKVLGDIKNREKEKKKMEQASTI